MTGTGWCQNQVRMSKKESGSEGKVSHELIRDAYIVSSGDIRRRCIISFTFALPPA